MWPARISEVSLVRSPGSLLRSSRWLACVLVPSFCWVTTCTGRMLVDLGPRVCPRTVRILVDHVRRSRAGSTCYGRQLFWFRS
eukprot:7389779-Prymnesium_polylepis.1